MRCAEPRFVVLLGAAALLALGHCDRKAAPAPEPGSLAAAEGNRWIDVLDPSKLGIQQSKPDLAVQALASRRKHIPPLTTPPKSEAARKKAKASADKLIEKGYALRKNPIWKAKPPIDWGKNPKKDSNWHYIVNSLRPIKPLVEAYQAGAGDRYLELARDVVLDWVDYNMVKNRPNEKKWHDMGSAFRGQVMATVLDLELRRPQPDVAAVGRLVWAIDEHATFLADPKVFTLGNHGFFMMQGLNWLLRGLPELKSRARFERYIDGQMKKLLTSQFAPDGLHLEHSPGYHTFITNSFAEAVADGSFPELVELRETVERAKLHYEELRHPNGDGVMLGDTGRTAAKFTGSDAPPSGNTSLLRGYPESGWAVFRSHFGQEASRADDYLLLSAGHHSHVHKHADHLSFEWSFGGVPVLIDSGKYTYNKDEWRKFFVSTRAGNAVEVDETDYATKPVNGKGNSKLSAWGRLEDSYYIVAEQRDQKLAVSQTRILLLSPGRYLLVVDQMRGKKAHTYRQWFHFHESLEVSEHGARVRVGSANQAPLLTVRDLAGGAEVELVKGQTKPRIQGFLSTKYLQKTPRFSLALRKRGTNATWATLFSPVEVQGAQVTERGDTLTVRWRDARGPQGFSFTRGAKPPVTPVPR